MLHQLRCSAALVILLAGTASPTAAQAPFSDARAVWHMKTAKPNSDTEGTLAVHGQVQLGVALEGVEREASLRRGGDGCVAQFEGGYLRAEFPADQPSELGGKFMTLYVRLRDATGKWTMPLLAKDDPHDPYGTLLYGADGVLHYLWRTQPAEQRVHGVAGSAARYGFNGEGNDQHHLADYTPGEFAISVLTLSDTGLVVLSHNGRLASGHINAQRQNTGAALFRVGAKHNDSELLEGDIAELLVYDRVISDEQRKDIQVLLGRKWSLDSAAAESDGPAAAQTLPTAGLVLHLDANDVHADPNQPGTPGPLAAWKDKSPRSRLLTQAAPARQPQLVPGVLAGKPVVRFTGGQWLDGESVLVEGGKTLTFVAVWKRVHAAGSQVICEQSAPGDGRRACLLTTGAAAGNPDFADGVLRLRVPTSVINPDGWHDVIVRFRDANLELFVDGVLVDEEWPHGALDQFCGPFLLGADLSAGQLRTGFRGAIDQVAIWDRALSDVEIAVLAGGAAETARRDHEMFGPVHTSPQYWKPRGYNAWAGDCMPFFHDGTFHLFYLFDRRHHASKWGQGAHQYAHLATQDLVHWNEHPLAVPIAQQWECSMGTCDCIWHDGVYYMFYTDCGSRCEYKDKPQQGSWIFCATSTDGVHFKKDFKPLVPGGDCTVFRDPATGLFHLVRGGGNRLVSSDLRNWQETPGDFVRRKEGTTGECPRHFQWNDWFYFILGTNAIWKSRGALGPWEEMKPTIYDGLFVPKVAEFTGNRRILAGFLFEQGWAGHLALRELVQYPDGSLGMRWPPELVPAGGEPCALAWTDRTGVASDGHSVTVRGAERLTTASLARVPHDARVSLRVSASPGVRRFGLCLGTQGDYESGCELRFEPGRERAQYGVPKNHGLADDASGRVAAGRDFAIEDVDGLDRPFDLEIIVRGDLIDTCIDHRRTMITRRIPQPEGDQLYFFAEGGDVTFSNIVIRPLE